MVEGTRTRAQLLAEAARLADDTGGVDVDGLLDHYYRHVPDADLAELDAGQILGIALSHLQLAGHRPPGSLAVRAHNPTQENDGWSLPRTVVEVVVDDMPFLVDSITAELTRQGRAIELVLHPQLVVDRDDVGRLTACCGPDGRTESWIHVQVEQVLEPRDLDRIAEELRRVVSDVRVAVEDWDDMATAAVRVAQQLVDDPPMGVELDDAAQAEELLRWLGEDHATLLGYAEYVLADTGDGRTVTAVEGSARGLLRRHGTGPDGPAGDAPQALERVTRPRQLVVTKAPVRSTVHRPAYLDSVAVRRFDDTGRVVGEHRFLGLFAAAAYTESVLRVPVVRQKAQAVLDRSGFAPMSHSGRDLLQVLETYPRDELFQAEVEDLEAVTLAVASLQERRQLRAFLRRDEDGNYVSCLVFLPRDRYTSDVRLRMEAVLREVFQAASIDFTVRLSESVLARVHFVARTAPGVRIPDVDAVALERRLVEVTRSWEDGLADALRASGPAAARLSKELPDAFPEAYKEDYPPAVGAADLLRVAALDPEDGLDMSLFRDPEGDGPDDLRFKVFSTRQVSLSVVLPMLRDMSVEVVDSRPYRLHGVRAYVYDFGLRAAGELHREREHLALLFQESFAAAWRGAIESDGLNALVLRRGMDHREVLVLRAYAKYLRQAGWSFSPSYVEQCLVSHNGIAGLLVRLFQTQFDPDVAGDRAPMCEELEAGIELALADVPSLDQDRILRSFLRAVRATTRTNHYQPAADGRSKPYLSLKLEPGTIPGLPQPRPEREVWVYSPRVEGVHLRFGAVARGGLRWSDRREDFRTEVLGLVKAQAVKNAVIVPVGAKGGFVAKKLPDPALDRDAWLAEGVESYRTLIRGMLDLTDNLVDGAVVPPERVVRRDADDSYLVVAADKGTATFSDIANAVAAEYDFWLGDAFASGGSAGYDHKEMGITARGAWESVERHFRELGIDNAVDDVTVVGIGDMAGDVFGNGMLLSRHLKLVAVFDHRHVFLDPDPDPETSFVERERLFALDRSSWLDYDPALLSEGGGVHRRTAKSIPVTPQVRERLGLPADCTELAPNELMSAILTAPVDLFWNGGIGTWVKAATEAHGDVGDKANDAVRVDGRDLRCRVVGEGGNLGLTQLGRIEAAVAGVRLNTDAIDNSAGVDCSDHEVNIKVLLDQVVRSGELPGGQRDALLVEMTDEVARLVLRDNREQNVLLGNARFHARPMLPVHRRYLRQLEEEGSLDRALEFMPTDAELKARAAAGSGLTSPELAVLSAYAKNTLMTEVLGTGLPDEPWFERHLRAYFPTPLIGRFVDEIGTHPLRRQIVANAVINEMVNRNGISFAFRAIEETEATVDEVVRAYSVATEVFGMREHWEAVWELGAPVPVDVQASLHLEARRLVDRVVRRLLRPESPPVDVATDVARYGPTVSSLLGAVPDMVRGAERRLLHGGVDRRKDQGVPPELAVRSVSLLHAFPLLDVAELAAATDEPSADVAELHYALSAAFDIDAHLGRITDLPRAERWQGVARASLRDDLYTALAGLTRDVLRTVPPGPPDERIAAWQERHAAPVARARARLQEITAGEVFDLAALSVVVRTVRSVLRT